MLILRRLTSVQSPWQYHCWEPLYLANARLEFGVTFLCSAVSFWWWQMPAANSCDRR